MRHISQVRRFVQPPWYWLKWRPKALGTIFDTGGFYENSHGYLHGVFLNGTVLVFINDAAFYYRFCTPAGYVTENQWVFITQTWSPLTAITLYIDGCRAINTGVQKRPRTTDIVWTAHFVIGDSAAAHEYRSNMELDHMQAWDEELSAEEVWQLYIQGGQVWMRKLGCCYGYQKTGTFVCYKHTAVCLLNNDSCRDSLWLDAVESLI